LNVSALAWLEICIREKSETWRKFYSFVCICKVAVYPALIVVCFDAVSSLLLKICFRIRFPQQYRAWPKGKRVIYT
jgi:hypothetical protein